MRTQFHITITLQADSPDKAYRELSQILHGMEWETDGITNTEGEPYSDDEMIKIIDESQKHTPSNPWWRLDPHDPTDQLAMDGEIESWNDDCTPIPFDSET